MRTNCNKCGQRGCRAIHAEVNNNFELILRERLPKELKGNDLTRCKKFKKLEPGKTSLRFMLSDQSLIDAHAAVWKADINRALASRE